MRRTEQLQGLRMLKLKDVLSHWQEGALSQLEAAEVLGMSERTFRRYVERFDTDGEAGLIDRRLGRRSGRAVPDETAFEVERLYRERYDGFTAKHFHEHLRRDHKFRWGYTWTKTFLQDVGLIKKAKVRGAHRRRRPRRPMTGMLVHQDASPHPWLEGHGPLDLVVTMDDATSEIYSAILVEEEGTRSSFMGLIETIAAKGLFCSLYTDRGSHYFHTPEAGGEVAKDTLTQVGRALSQLGIEHIPAYSPQARGRSERLFRTLQDRLPKELKLAGIGTIEEANRFLKDTYIAGHNARFAVAPAETGSAFVPVAEAQWRDILCIQEERAVAPDNTVSWQAKRLQIPPHPARAHFVRAKVRVHQYPDGGLAIFHGPRCLIRWRPGETQNETQTQPTSPRQPVAREAQAQADGDDLSTVIPVIHSPNISHQPVNSCAT
jgi:transposase